MIRHTRPAFVDHHRGATPGRTIVPAFLLLASAGLAADPKPPKPDPAKPVNYIKWINETLGAEIKENAADMYQRAFDKLTPFDIWNDGSLRHPWTANQKVLVWVSANREAMDLFRQAAVMPDCYFPIEDKRANTGDPRLDHMFPGTALFPDFNRQQTLVDALIAEGCAAWRRGDETTLLKEAIFVRRFARHLDNTAILTQWLTAGQLAGEANDTLRRLLGLSSQPGILATRILNELQTIGWHRPPMRQATLGDRLMAMDYAQRLFIPGNKPGTWLVYAPLMANLAAPLPEGFGDLVDEKEYNRAREALKRLPAIGFDTTLRQINDFYDELEQWCEKPFASVASEADRLDARPRSDKTNPLLRILPTQLAWYHRCGERADASHRATLLICHILIHHSQTGSYPASLDELKAADLKKIRIDPFSGRDFVYRRQLQGFLLYSAGENLKDDGGQHDETWPPTRDDVVFWPAPPPPKPYSPK